MAFVVSYLDLAAIGEASRTGASQPYYYYVIISCKNIVLQKNVIIVLGSFAANTCVHGLRKAWLYQMIELTYW